MKKKMGAKAKAGMKKQLIAQLRNKAKAKRKDDFSMSEDELKAQVTRPMPKDESGMVDWMSGRAKERMEVQTWPCADCGQMLNYNNRSILTDGTVIHIGCKKAKKRTQPEPERKLAGLPKHKGVKVPKPPKQPERKYGHIMACSDYQGRTCLQLDRGVNSVTYVDIASALEFGLHLQYMPLPQFDKRFYPLENFPVEKAVKTYLGFAKDYGATKDVLDWLARVVKPTKEEEDMVTKKLNAKKAGTNGNGHGKGKKSAPGAKKPGSGARIRELVLKAMPTEKILAIIHKEFPGSKAKASDVSWNKGKLRKDGVKVPEPKG